MDVHQLHSPVQLSRLHVDQVEGLAAGQQQEVGLENTPLLIDTLVDKSQGTLAPP